MAEDRTEAHSVGRDIERLTITEAATLLGVHKNTIRNRIKDGTYKAEKVITERGPTYMIERESLLTNLTNNTLSSDSQELVSPQAMEFVQQLLRPFVSELGEIREQLGAERARREVLEQARAALEDERRQALAHLEEQLRRREEIEREREDLRRKLQAVEAELEALREPPEAAEESSEPRESPVTSGPREPSETPQPTGGEAHAATEEQVEGPEERLSWWRRWFGG